MASWLTTKIRRGGRIPKTFNTMTKKNIPETHESGTVPPLSEATGSAPCSCWETMNNLLREKGFKIADACSGFVMTPTSLEVRRYLPLQRADGKKPKRTEPKGVSVSFCPFCGQSLLPNDKEEPRGPNTGE